jgi:hypothetical protein
VTRRLIAVAAVVATAACSLVGIDLDSVIAVEVTVPDSGRVEEGDTLLLSARALNARGDSVPGAVFVWERIDTGKIILDAATGRVIGVTPTSAVRVRARHDNLPSNPISLAVLAAADTVQPEPAGAVRDTIFSSVPADSLSSPLQVKLLDLTTNPPPAAPAALANRPVTFSLTLYPGGNGGARLVVAAADTGVTQLVVKTGATGLSAVRVKLRAGQTLPDSAVVAASATRANGSTVPGSPVTFSVVVQP